MCTFNGQQLPQTTHKIDMQFLIILSILTSNALSLHCKNEPPTINVKQGKVMGTIMTSSEGKEFYAFLGIPYGKIPRRFERAQLADKWTGTWNATVDGPVCRQATNINSTTMIGQEDCLFINVYTQKSKKLRKYPVLVFIHGGGFVFGSASSTIYKPNNFMNKDIILVAMNYRLAAQGFLSTGDEQSPGNYGLLDQVLALEWIRDNIKSFGGHPRKVVIFGESSGAGCVILHLLSPRSKGLFSAAIAQSGSALCTWCMKDTPLQTAQQLAQNLQCPTESTSEMVACLRQVDVDQLILKTRPGALISSMSPVIENPTSGQFLTESPLKLLQEQRFNKVPLISGVNSDEAVLFIKAMENSDALTGLDENSDDVKWANAISNLLYLTYPYSVLSSEDVTKIKKKYFQGANFSDKFDILRREIELSSDATFKSWNDETIKLMAAAGVPVYMYVLDQIPSSPVNTQYSGKPDVVHGVDLAYLFNASILPFTFSDEDVKISKIMVDLWTNFAYYRNPTPFRKPIRWHPADSRQIRYLKIASKLSMVEGYRAEEMQFWHDIFYAP